MHRITIHFIIVCMLYASIMGSAAVAQATASSDTSLASGECTSNGTALFDGAPPQIDSGDVNRAHPRVSASPARIVYSITPGRRYVVSVHVKNSTPAPVRLEPRVIRLEAADNTSAFVQPSRLQLPRGFVFELPQQLPLLAPGDALDMPVRVSIASCTPAGIAAVGVALRQVLSPPATNTDTGPRIQLGADLVAELILEVPGETITRMSLRNLHGARIAWPGEHPTFSAVVQNEGTSLIDLRGDVELDAFANHAARTLHTDQVLILPGGSRRISATWNDPPVFGWFRPTLRVSQDGVTQTVHFTGVLVLPPWWVLVAIVLAVALPTWLQLHRRHRKPR